jgi:hypothetical protein
MDQLISSFKLTNEFKWLVMEMTVVIVILLYCANSFVSRMTVWQADG